MKYTFKKSLLCLISGTKKKQLELKSIRPERRNVAGQQDELSLTTTDGLEGGLVAQSVLHEGARG